jgi:hypothetical protein
MTIESFLILLLGIHVFGVCCGVLWAEIEDMLFDTIYVSRAATPNIVRRARVAVSPSKNDAGQRTARKQGRLNGPTERYRKISRNPGISSGFPVVHRQNR